MFGNNFESSDFILSKVREVTSNAALIKYIENGIKKIAGNLRINVVKDDKCDFGFKNQNGDYFYININDDKVYIYNNTLNLREEVVYDKSQDGIQIEFYGNYRVFDDGGLVVLKNIEEKSFYDSNKKFIMSDTHIEHNTCLDGNIMKKFMGTNYDLNIKQCVVDDEIVKLEDISYHYIPEMNSKKYFISEYRNGLLCSVNEKEYSLPLYSQVSGNFNNYLKKIRSIEKNNAQKQKTML